MRLAVAVIFIGHPAVAASSYTLIGWNDLGMHCMDADYSVFSILPPYNTIHAQLIDSTGKLVKSGAGIKITYEAIADPTGSINLSSSDKTNYWVYAAKLFGFSGASNGGLTGNSMPGSANTPQGMTFDSALSWFTADGIPLTNYDDQLNKNYYPMMKLVARDAANAVLATTRIVLPVSDEMDCRACHKSGLQTTAVPAAGWVYDSNPDRDYKLNILLKHDERNHRNQAYTDALQTAGYTADGLYATALGGTPILCARCHSTTALSAAGIKGIPSLTSSMHSWHAAQTDPATGLSMDDASNRDSCYRCHPGSATRCLRGAMGNAVATDGTMSMQCQNCHGKMSVIGDSTRTSWLSQPNCQACHTGTAMTALAGQMRSTSVFDTAGKMVRPSDTTFATTANQPATGYSLYRFSSGHGGLMCEACHGSTHAEFPSSHANDNLQSADIQGFAGPLQECTACHKSGISSTNGGPHGMHDVGAGWVNSHANVAERNRTQCTACHGGDYRGTVLSRAFTTRTLSTRFGTIQMFRGYQVSCYTCHNGPGGSGNAPTAATVSNTSASATTGQAVKLPVSITNGGTLRIVAQPLGGTAFVNGSTITYTAYADFEGSDSLTYAALANGKDSNMGTATVKVTAAARPSFTSAAVANAAGYQAGSVAPGMLITVFGSGLGPPNLETLKLISSGYVQKELAGTRVLFDGVASPVVFSSLGQIAAAVPYAVAGKLSTSMVVESGGIKSNAIAVPVITAAPAIFTSDASGKGQAKALNQDYTVNGASSRAKAGDVIVLYVTGEGAAKPTGADGKLSVAPFSVPEQAVTVRIGGVAAVVQYAGAAPGLIAGVMQVNATIPSGLPAGASEVIVTAGGASSPAGVTIQLK